MCGTHARRNRSSKARGSLATKLVPLAQSLWGPLSAAEVGLLQAIESKPGHEPDSEEGTAPAGTDLSPPVARVRAGLLRWLCTSSEAAAAIDTKGLRVQRVLIDGTLDLESINCSFPLRIQDCVIAGAVRLNHAKFPYVRICDTTVDELKANRIRLEGSLVLTGLRVRGELSLQGAAINGNLQLDKAHLSSPGGCALNLEGANIGGAVNMREGFRSDGHIRLFSTQIGKNLECAGAIVAARSMEALLIESAKIGGSILLRNGFRSLGQVRVFGTVLEGNLDVQGARLTARRNAALNVYGSRIKGSLVLRSGEAKYRSRCLGGVRITRSFIDGHLDLSNARIRARARPAGDMLDLKIEGRLIAQAARIDGELILARAIVGNDAIFFAARLTNPGGRALKARGFHCGGSLLLGEQFKASGSVELFGAYVGDEFNAIGSTFEREGGVALDLRESTIHRFASCANCKVVGTAKWSGASVGSTVNLSKSRFEGELDLTRTQIGGHLFLDGAKLSAGARLQADGLRCKGSLFLGDGFEAPGGGLFYGAVVEGDFYSSNSIYGNGTATSLNLSGARIGGHLLLTAATLMGTAWLELASVGGRLSFSRTTIAATRGAGRRRNAALYANGCSIGSEARFDGGFTARGALLLDRAHIAGSLSLASCLVLNRKDVAISLLGASIQGDVDAGRTFGDNARFQEARLLGEMNVSKASIEGSVDLSGMWILNRGGDALRAERMKVKGSLDLRQGFTTNGGIDLRDATVGSYFDAEASWSSAHTLRLEGLTYATIVPAVSAERLRWLEHGKCRSSDAARKPLMADPVSLQPHEQLIQALKKQGHERDARKIAIAKQAYMSKHSTEGRVGRWMHRLYGATIQFGYRPQRALRFAPAFLIALCMFFYTGADSLMVPVNPLAEAALKQGKALPSGYPSFNAVAYAVETFVPILNLQQKESWRPDDRARCDPGPERCGFWLRVYLWFHMAAGWIITTLAVAGFTGLVRKD
ncbi:hypothetical protein [Cupriavidus basilensis]|nr:hypothetical protein [Cupriavidus basilensis]